MDRWNCRICTSLLATDTLVDNKNSQRSNEMELATRIQKKLHQQRNEHCSNNTGNNSVAGIYTGNEQQGQWLAS